MQYYVNYSTIQLILYASFSLFFFKWGQLVELKKIHITLKIKENFVNGLIRVKI